MSAKQWGEQERGPPYSSLRGRWRRPTPSASSPPEDAATPLVAGAATAQPSAPTAAPWPLAGAASPAGGCRGPAGFRRTYFRFAGGACRQMFVVGGVTDCALWCACVASRRCTVQLHRAPPAAGLRRRRTPGRWPAARQLRAWGPLRRRPAWARPDRRAAAPPWGQSSRSAAAAPAHADSKLCHPEPTRACERPPTHLAAAVRPGCA